MSKDFDTENGTVGIELINKPIRAMQRYLYLIKNASSEILLVFPTVNALRREEKIGVLNELAAAASRGVRVRVLTPEDDFVKEQMNLLESKSVQVRKIENPSEFKFKLLIIDKKFGLVVETKDDSKSEFQDAIGLVTISTSKERVYPYIGIFESFWKEVELSQKAREAERIKDEFVNIAAHELRSPIMPIMTSMEILKDDIEQLLKTTTPNQQNARIRGSLDSSLRIILRNFTRLIKISEDILQVSKIESGTFTLNTEPVEINSLIHQVLDDIKQKYSSEKSNVEYVIESKLDYEEGKFILFCDKAKIVQVIFNLLDNANKFTSKGKIVLSVRHKQNEILISVKDCGVGIDPLIKERLFEKFASMSEKGTGLGLYLSRKIVEAHGGRIWAANNPDGKGATFSFTLPTDLKPEINGLKTPEPQW